MKSAENKRRKRLIFLFVAVIVIPALVLVPLAIQVIRQAKELEQTRMADQRRAAVEQLRRELAARLQTIQIQEAGRLVEAAESPSLARPPETDVVFVLPIRQGRIVLPWDAEFDPTAPSAEFTRHRLVGENLEFIAQDAAGAAARYRQALRGAHAPIEKCKASLSIGRTLLKAGRREDAAGIYRGMLKECASIRDAEGMDFSLYAAERLISQQLDPGIAEAHLFERTAVRQWRPPIQAYLMRSLLRDVAGDKGERALATLTMEIRDIEAILALANDPDRQLGRLDFPLRTNPADSVWLAYGSEPWMITVMSPASFAPPVVLAVSSRSIAPPGATLMAAGTATSSPVGEGFLDLHVEWPADRFAAAAGLPMPMYAAGIMLILGATVLAAYLLLRDVDREVQMAEMRSHFVASVSHELKTPLTSIRMFAETLALGRSGSEKHRTDYLHTIVNESERLSRLVDNVLDFSRIERGKKIYRMEPASLAGIVRSAARAMQYPLQQQGFALALSIDEGLPVVNADADALEQAILNLLTNATKYSGESREIGLTLKRHNGDGVIEVVDRGLGIAPEHQRKIFDRFYRVRSTDTDLIGGTGLGLTLAQHIVQAHHGHIDVQSEIGRGTVFSVHIPLNDTGATS